MNKRFCFALDVIADARRSETGNVQDIGSGTSEFAPVAFFRALGNKLTGNSSAPAALEQPQLEDSPAVSSETGPARADEVLSPRSQARMSNEMRLVRRRRRLFAPTARIRRRPASIIAIL
jgi:hypothetical protein